jgi:hypothetical protein
MKKMENNGRETPLPRGRGREKRRFVIRAQKSLLYRPKASPMDPKP